MQEQTNKDQESSRTRANPIHIVPTSRQSGANADALREVHMSLVRAEQNLYNLVQASHANGQAAFAYAAPQAFPAGYAAPAFPPGFAPAGAVSAPAYGFATQPNGMGHPAVGYAPAPGLFAPAPVAYSQPILGFGQAPTAVPQWSPLAGITALPGALVAGLSALSTALAAGIAALPGATGAPAPLAAYPASAWMQNRTPACDIADEGKAFVCRVDLPGLRADQVELLCLEQAVIVTGVREADGESVSLVQSERGIASQQRTIVLPASIQPAGTKATLSNGILTVTLPKVTPTEGPRRIKVQG